MHRHPTIRSWVREEDGAYKAELHGFELHVTWKPGDRAGERGFLWKATKGETVLESAGLEEEIEAAMGAAEGAAEAAGAPALPEED